MPRSFYVAYVLILVVLAGVGFIWEAPAAVKALVGAAAMIPISAAFVVAERRRRASMGASVPSGKQAPL